MMSMTNKGLGNKESVATDYGIGNRTEKQTDPVTGGVMREKTSY